MGRLLDLSIYKPKTQEIRLPDGRLLHIKCPTQKLTVDMLAYANLNEDEVTVEQAIKALDEIVSKILSHNTDGITISPDYVANELVYMKGTDDENAIFLKMAVLNAFQAFTKEIQSNPN